MSSQTNDLISLKPYAHRFGFGGPSDAPQKSDSSLNASKRSNFRPLEAKASFHLYKKPEGFQTSTFDSTFHHKSVGDRFAKDVEPIDMGHDADYSFYLVLPRGYDSRYTTKAILPQPFNAAAYEGHLPNAPHLSHLQLAHGDLRSPAHQQVSEHSPQQQTPEPLALLEGSALTSSLTPFPIFMTSETDIQKQLTTTHSESESESEFNRDSDLSEKALTVDHLDLEGESLPAIKSAAVGAIVPSTIEPTAVPKTSASSFTSFSAIEPIRLPASEIKDATLDVDSVIKDREQKASQRQSDQETAFLNILSPEKEDIERFLKQDQERPYQHLSQKWSGKLILILFVFILTLYFVNLGLKL